MASLKHCPVNVEDIIAVAQENKDVAEIKFLLELKNDVVLEEIANGDVNFNFRCSTKGNDKDVFVKYSAPYIKSTPEVKLPVTRLASEFTSMGYCSCALPGSVPKPLAYSAQKNLAMFEFLEGFREYETAVVEGQINQQTVTSLATILGKLHNSTHRNTLGDEAFQELKAKLNVSDQMEDIGEFYFRTGYSDPTALSQLKPEHKQKSLEFRNDHTVMNLLDQVRHYLDAEECLIHNDLHFNSVMVNHENAIKLIDFEFASLGHPARDVAMVLAQFLALHYFHMLTPENNDQHRRIAYKLQEACTQFMDTYYTNMRAYSGTEDEFKRHMIVRVSGLVGAELCARVLSTPHIPSIQPFSHVTSVETEMLACGLRLLRKHEQINSLGKMLFIGLQLC